MAISAMTGLVFFLIASTLGKASSEISWGMDEAVLVFRLILIYAAQTMLAWIAGFFLKNDILRNSFVLSASSKNIQLMLAVAVLNFDPAVSLPIALGIFGHHLSNGFWLWITARKSIL